MQRNIFIAVLVSVGIFVFSACNLKMKNLDEGFYFNEKTFISEWNAWKNKGIRNYSFTMTGELPHWDFSKAILMYEYKVNITVKNGVMDSFEYIGDIPHGEDENSILEPEFTSISDMYQKISDRAKEEKEWWKKNHGEEGIVSTKYEVNYDAQLHYITSFEPVSEWESGWIVDTADHAVTISNFTVLDMETENSDIAFYFDEQTFVSEWNAWKNKNIGNYSFTMIGKLPSWNFSRAIFMHEYKVNIIVRNGIMDSFEYIGNVPYGEDEKSVLEPEFTSIFDIYQKISDRAKEEKEWWEKYSGGGGIISTAYDIKYNTQLHYITFFEPVSEWESGWIVDTTVHAVTISNFTVLKDK